ncbi:MAG: DUF1858 domain-containing protein [Candidatus Firestonebacteria bacterium]
MSDIVKIDKDTMIGEVLRKYPQAKSVIEKYFGGGCFTCAGINVESLSFGAMMHNIEPETLVNEINAAISKKE